MREEIPDSVLRSLEAAFPVRPSDTLEHVRDPDAIPIGYFCRKSLHALTSGGYQTLPWWLNLFFDPKDFTDEALINYMFPLIKHHDSSPWSLKLCNPFWHSSPNKPNEFAQENAAEVTKGVVDGEFMVEWLVWREAFVAKLSIEQIHALCDFVEFNARHYPGSFGECWEKFWSKLRRA